MGNRVMGYGLGNCKLCLLFKNKQSEYFHTHMSISCFLWFGFKTPVPFQVTRNYYTNPSALDGLEHVLMYGHHDK